MVRFLLFKETVTDKIPLKTYYFTVSRAIHVSWIKDLIHAFKADFHHCPQYDRCFHFFAGRVIVFDTKSVGQVISVVVQVNMVIILSTGRLFVCPQLDCRRPRCMTPSDCCDSTSISSTAGSWAEEVCLDSVRID